jgi:hypothetical protein
VTPPWLLRDRLAEAAGQGIDPAANLAPIRALLEQGCDLEAGIAYRGPDRARSKQRPTCVPTRHQKMIILIFVMVLNARMTFFLAL